MWHLINTLKDSSYFKRKVRKAKKKKIEVEEYENDLTPVIGYSFTPSYIRSGNRWGTVVKLVNKYGMNRNYEFGWMVGVIPEITVDGVKGYLIETDKAISKQEQNEIIKENVRGNVKGYEHSLDDGSDDAEASLKVKHINDLNTALYLDSAANKIIDWKLVLLLVSDSPDKLEEQLLKLQTLYDENMLGIRLASYAGDQQEMFAKLLSQPDGSIYEYTSMSSDFAGNDHAIRKGLNDANGWAIGNMALSYSSGVAFMALDDSFKQKILIASHRGAYVEGYDKKAPSLWGQLIANNAMVHKHRTYHIVLNDFEYFGDPTGDTYIAKPSLEKVIERINLGKGGLNPIEYFGDRSEVRTLYNKNLDKLTQIFYLLSNRELDPNTRGKLREELNKFYIGQKLWDRNYPEREKVLETDSAKLPTLGEFVSYLGNAITTAKASSTEREVDRATTLSTTLRGVLDSYTRLFNERSTLGYADKKDKYQYYYDLSDLKGESNVLEAQFLNTFDYITAFAKPKDIIMIHGIDLISVETIEIIKSRLDNLERSGVRLAYIFDTIGAGDKKRRVETADIFNTDGLLYTSFESDFDYTIIGKMTAPELNQYESKVAPAREGDNNQKLSNELRTYLTTGRENKFQIRRPADATNNFVLGNFII